MAELSWRKHWEDWLNAAFGAWVAISPWILGYATVNSTATWNSYVVGIVILAVAILALVRFQVWEEWVNCVLGLWLIASPWLLGYGDLRVAAWNHVVLGVLIAGVSLVEIWQTRPGRKRLT